MTLRIATAAFCAALALMAGCTTAPPQPQTDEVFATRDAQPVPPARGGGYYKDDGPGTSEPDIATVLDAEPRTEPLHRFANSPYRVLGVAYTPMRTVVPFRQRGLASWYGRKFHGQNTSSGEKYDMYAMTAAHPTLPIPSYAKVTNLRNGRSVVVRVNDRGPFHAGRVIDLSWTAAAKLGYIDSGSTQVEVELIQPRDYPLYARRSEPTVVAAVPPPKPAAPGFAVISSAQAAESTGGAPVYLQIGAFVTRENADALQERVVRELAWLKDFVGVDERNGSYRVQIGPYKNRTDASSAADRVREAMQITPVLVTR